jgi:Kef-type K+ transport system membrane component KefB
MTLLLVSLQSLCIAGAWHIALWQTGPMPTLHPMLWVMLAAVVAPLLSEIPRHLRVPVVVFEILLGIAIGPHGLGLVQFDGFVAAMFGIGMGATLFMAGMELDFKHISGQPMWLALGGWSLSLLLGLAAAMLLYLTPLAHAPVVVMLALSTTALGTMLPLLRDAGQLDSDFGRLFLAAGTVAEVGPVLAMSLAMSQQYSTWQEAGFLLLFIALVLSMAIASSRRQPPRLVAVLRRHLHASSQLPVRVALLVLAGYFVLADLFGFENILGAFAAGVLVGMATRGDEHVTVRHKIDAVMFGWFVPFFFVGTGLKFDLRAITQDATTALLVPAFALLLLAVRGVPVLLYGRRLQRHERWPFALMSAVASLSLVVVITDIAVHTGHIGTPVAAAMVGAGVLSVLLFPTLAGLLLAGSARGVAPAEPGV